jgi:hypothetical protein
VTFAWIYADLVKAVSNRALQEAGAVGIGMRRSLRCGPCLHGVALVGSLAMLVAGRLSHNIHPGCTRNVLNQPDLPARSPRMVSAATAGLACASQWNMVIAFGAVFKALAATPS